MQRGFLATLRRAVVTAALCVPAGAVAQDGSVVITGRVTSENGSPLLTANVGIPELSLFVTAQANGAYRLVVPSARVRGQQVNLVARTIGYTAQSSPVRLNPNETLTRDFTLKQDPLRLQEVVVTGAGTQGTVEHLGTARASVTGTEVQKANTPSNFVAGLAGKIPNVVTQQQGGDAGAGASIQIRGPKSFGTSQPVFVVDGVVMGNQSRGAPIGVLQGPPTQNRIADVNPEDIESIEILKGAAAASIYGASAGSAGAVLITTKRGRAGRNQYTLRSSLQADQPIKYLPMQRTFGMGINGVSTACTTVNCQVSAGNARSWGPALASGTPTYDHGREIYETGQLYDNTISMSGGTDRTTFYVSGGALTQDGFIEGNTDIFQRYTVRLTASHSVSDQLSVGGSASYVNTRSKGVDRNNSTNGIGLAAYRTPPEFNQKQFLDATNGLHRSFRFPNPGPTCATRTTAACDRGWDNPFYAIAKHDLSGQTGRVFGNVNAQYSPLNWLQAAWTLGVDHNADDRTYAYDVTSAGKLNGDLERWQFTDRTIDHNLTVTGTKTLNENMTGSVTLGQNINEIAFRQVDVVGQTFISNQPYKISNITTLLQSSSTDLEQKRHTDGYFVQTNLELYDQLFLQGRVRNDGSSAFGPGKQRATYPGGTIAWSFTKGLSIPSSILTFGKLRLAYGESGQQPGFYLTQSSYSTATFADFSPASLQAPLQNGLGGAFPGLGKGNPDIAPERVQELEAGFDLSFLNGKADLSVTRYDAKSNGVIFGVGLAPSSGFTTIQLNAGSLSNKGWEVSTNYRPYETQNLAIEFGASWATNRNRVESLGRIDAQTCTEAIAANCATGTVQIPTPETCTAAALLPRCQIGIGSSFTGQTSHAQLGYPLGVWRSTDFARCGISGNSVTFSGTTYDLTTACAGAPHGALYIAPNGFPITDPTARAIGNPHPDWTGSLSSAVTVRGVQVSAFLDHRQGGNVLNMTRASMYQFGTHKDTEIRGQTRTFGKDMLCSNVTCEVINGPVVGPGANTPIVVNQSWFDGGSPGNGQAATGGPISGRLEDATHTRLREVTVGYTFNQGWVSRLGGSRSMDVKFAVRNVALWADYSGLDPETNIGGAQNANRGIDFFGTPLSRGYSLTVSLNR